MNKSSWRDVTEAELATSFGRRLVREAPRRVIPAAESPQDVKRVPRGTPTPDYVQVVPDGERRPFKPHLLLCPLCRTTFTPTTREQRFCSLECGRKGHRSIGGANKPLPLSESVCCLCAKAFHVAPTRRKRPGGGKFCSIECYAEARARNPEAFPQTANRRGRGGRRADLGNSYYRSSWEANWARYLNWLLAKGEIKEWLYESETFEFEGIKRGSRFYTPDFKIYNNDGTIERHELKGYMDARSATKLKRMASYHPEAKITLIDKIAYAAVARMVASTIPHWEDRRP